jgi:hypothetical protein
VPRPDLALEPGAVRPRIPGEDGASIGAVAFGGAGDSGFSSRDEAVTVRDGVRRVVAAVRPHVAD